MGRLDAPTISSLAATGRAYKRSDGFGLFIFVSPAGSKLWRMAYRFEGRQKTLSFGAWPIVSIEDARAKCLKAKSVLHCGMDPAIEARAHSPRARRARKGTFNAVADEYIDKRQRDGLAAVTLMKKRWLVNLARPQLGHRLMPDICARDVLSVLKDVEARGLHETAKRLRTTLGEIFRYSIVTLRSENDPTPALRGLLTRPQVRHMPAIIEADRFAHLVRQIWAYEGRASAALALKLMTLLYPRPGELRLARWPEFDLDRCIWNIPAERMKMRRPHTKPLPAAAVRILRALPGRADDQGFLFPGAASQTRPMSENTMNLALCRLGFERDEMTPHGFRSSASSMLNESGLWNPDAIEAELAHHDVKSVRTIYNRATYWDERVRMAEWWSQYVFSKTNRL